MTKSQNVYFSDYLGNYLKYGIIALLLILQTCSTENSPQQQVDLSRQKSISPEQISVVKTSANQVLELVKNSNAKVVMLNVWATWCQPCKEEFPDMMKLRHFYKAQGLDLILVSGDFPDQLPAVKKFLAKQGVDFPTYIKTDKDMKFINTLNPDWSGALPATWIFDGSGHLYEFWQGKASFDRMEKSVLEVLNQNAAGRRKVE